jgi:hypothetical protein
MREHFTSLLVKYLLKYLSLQVSNGKVYDGF